MELEFWVTICLGHGDGGDVAVTLDVTDAEYELLKKCCRENEDFDGFKGLEDLYERIAAAARDESECCEPDDCEEIDYDEASYTVAIPDIIYNEVQEEN
jgi:hypothetical protein